MHITSGIITGPQKVCLYGVEGIGKTSLAAKFPDPLFIDTEGGSKHLDVKRLDTPTSWTMIMEQIRWVKTNPECCNTLVIDTVDWAEMLCIDHICAQHGKTGLEGWEYGKGYVYLAEEFGRFLNLLSDLPAVDINVLLVAHSKVKKEERPDEYGGYDRWMLKLSDSGQKRVAPLVKEWADALLFINYKLVIEQVDAKSKKNKARGGERMIYTTHHACWDAKNRWGLPDEIPLDFELIAPHIPVRGAAPTTPAPTTPAAAPAASPKPDPKPAAADAPNGPVKAGQSITYDAAGNTVSVQPIAPAQQAAAVPQRLQPLFDLMEKDGITEEQVRGAIGARGYKTKETPMDAYEEGFVNWLVAQWPTIRDFIQNELEVPFD